MAWWWFIAKTETLIQRIIVFIVELFANVERFYIKPSSGYGYIYK